MLIVTRRSFLGFSLAGPALLATEDAHNVGATAAAGPTGTQVHQELVEGNLRFVNEQPVHPHSSKSWIQKQAEGQHPRAAVLCCADSRVSPEILFDHGIGDLFVVRVAGNVVNEDELASLVYAIEHLNVPLCLVLGHSNCGAVRAVVEGASEPIEIQHLVAPIQASFAKVKKNARTPLIDAALMQETVVQNVTDNVVKLMSTTPLLEERIQSKRLRVEGAVYDLVTGRVAWLPA